MSTQTQPAPVLAWHREAARHAVVYALREQEAAWDDIAAIIAQHDPHQAQNATTVRLLNEALDVVDEQATDERAFWGANDKHGCAADMERFRNEIRAHLAKLKGTQ